MIREVIMKKYLFLVLLFLPLNYLNAQHGHLSITPDEAKQKLIDGNQRFITQEPTTKEYYVELQKAEKGQHPYAVVLTCSDSRVPPEIIFDESIGKLFVIRVAGNVIDQVTLGSIEYAVEHLGCSYVLILGHNHCGAVTATVKGGENTPAVEEIARLIMPAVEKAKEENKTGNDLIDLAIIENINLQIKYSIEMSELLSHFVNDGKIKIAGGLYNISTGRVEFLPD